MEGLLKKIFLFVFIVGMIGVKEVRAQAVGVGDSCGPGAVCVEKTLWWCSEGEYYSSGQSVCEPAKLRCCMATSTEVCEGKNVGTVCQVGSLEGTCQLTGNPRAPGGQKLYCKVDEKDSVTACKGKGEGAYCTFGKDQKEGTCSYGRNPNAPRILYCDNSNHECDAENVGKNCAGGICKKVVSGGQYGQVQYLCLPHDDVDPERLEWLNEYEPPERDIRKMDEEPLGIGGLGGIVTEVINYLFPLAGFICLIFIIQGGYMWIVSAGNPESVRKAQGTLTWAIIGLVLTMTVFGILTVLLKFLYK